MRAYGARLWCMPLDRRLAPSSTRGIAGQVWVEDVGPGFAFYLDDAEHSLAHHARQGMVDQLDRTGHGKFHLRDETTARRNGHRLHITLRGVQDSPFAPHFRPNIAHGVEITGQIWPATDKEDACRLAHL